MRVSAALVMLLWAGLAGCLDDRPDYEAAEDAVAGRILDDIVADHDHRDPTLHGGAHNMALLGYHNGVDDSGDPDAIPPGGYYLELAVGDRYVYMTGASSGGLGEGAGEWGGFSIIDTTDPSDPYLVSRYPGPTGSDIEVDDQESLVFFGTQRNTVEQVIGTGIATQDPGASLPRGIYVVDVGDKSAPELALFEPLPYNGVHTLEYVRHPSDGSEYLIACTYDLYGNTVPSSQAGAANTAFPSGAFAASQRVVVYELQRSPAVSLTPVSEYQILDQAPEGRYIMPHDTFVQQHPFDGNVYLYVAYWDKGVRILDFNDPTQLREVSGYGDFLPSERINIHQVRAFPEPIDGTHVTVAEPEIIDAAETGQITFIDTSDPTAPRKLGHWSLPHPGLIVQGLDFSPHNFDVWDGKVALAHYHSGLWVLDASDAENLGDPKGVGYYIPQQDRSDSPVRTPSIWSAFWRDGLIFATDEATGLHILEYTGP